MSCPYSVLSAQWEFNQPRIDNLKKQAATAGITFEIRGTHDMHDMEYMGKTIPVLAKSNWTVDSESFGKDHLGCADLQELLDWISNELKTTPMVTSINGVTVHGSWEDLLTLNSSSAIDDKGVIYIPTGMKRHEEVVIVAIDEHRYWAASHEDLGDVTSLVACVFGFSNISFLVTCGQINTHLERLGIDPVETRDLTIERDKK